MREAMLSRLVSASAARAMALSRSSAVARLSSRVRLSSARSWLSVMRAWNSSACRLPRAWCSMLAGGLVQLGGCGIALGGGPAADAVQPVALFLLAAAGLGAAVVLPQPLGAAVLAGQGGDDVDVAGGVADADPPRRVRVSVWGETDRGGDLGCDVFPLPVGQDRVVGVVVDRAVPDWPGGQFEADAGGLFEQFGQPPHRGPAVQAGRWLQLGEAVGGGVGPRRDDARVVVPAAALVVQTRAEQVAQQPAQVADGAALVDLRDQLDLPMWTPAGAGRWA